ncbi:MAG: hypothetical protein ABIG28_01760 [archaeon]
MKAITMCPNCKETVTTDCKGCIDGGNLFHACSKDGEPDVFDVTWKKFPENEKELNQLEEECK